jgi:hypothetical protein
MERQQARQYRDLEMPRIGGEACRTDRCWKPDRKVIDGYCRLPRWSSADSAAGKRRLKGAEAEFDGEITAISRPPALAAELH